MGWQWLLLVPLGFALVAHETGAIAAKLGVALSCALLVYWAYLFSPTRGRRDVVWVVVALCLSAAGDWFLSSRSGREAWFIIGIALFFGAHAGFLVYAWRRGGVNRYVLAVLCLVYLPYYVVWLRPTMPSSLLATAVLLYLLISCLAFSVAAGLRMPSVMKWPFLAGIGLILFSDTLISLKEFLKWGRGLLILPTYYLAHLCITWTVLTEVSEGRTSEEDPKRCLVNTMSKLKEEH